MLKRSLTWFVLLSLTVAGLMAQGQTTNATKDDWEEINFETSSAVLTDGYPSLLRLAELLTKNPGYKVRVEGHTDGVGSKRANEKLGMQRAQAVKSFLEKYGARPDQITATTQGMGQPKVGNDTKEGRWMNRRTMLYVTDAQGRPVSAGGVGDAIRNLNAATGGPAAAADPKCCDEILKRLDKLDDILALLRTMKGDHDKLAGEVAKLKEDNQKLAAAAAAPAAGLAPQAKQDVADISKKAIEEAMAKNTSPKWSILGANAGADSEGRLTFTGKGRYFAPIGKSSAIQSEAEYMYFRDRQEGQFDAGLVQRLDKIQMGLFSSFKHASFSQFQSGGTLGQGAIAVDYLFKRGRLGLFGTKAFLNNAVVNRAPVSPNVFLETYMRAVDQIGGSTSVALWKDTYVEGNLGFLRAYGGGNKPGGMVRFVQPLNKMVALSIEGGLNETLIGKNNSGAVRFGILFGNWLRPKDYGTVDTPVPMDIPRVRYELLTRRVRTGNGAPIADAGGDQNVSAGNVRLDGSASYDPDGDPITFQWTQVAGPTVALSNPNAAVAGFTAVAGANYAFRLTVKDDQGAQATARANVNTRAAQAVRILRFQANPVQVRAGQPVNLLWLIENADSATISPVVGSVNATQGTTQVTPTETTTYRLTARNATSEAVETVTVNVERPLPRIISFQGTPATINRGDASTLAWQTENADTVTVTGVGTVRPNGTAPVSPTETTTYTITATNQFGSTSATAVIQVGTPGPGGGGDGLPRIIRFTGSPMDITAGERSSLDWLVENATAVTISTLGTVGLQGNSSISPTANTLYTITASNAVGQVSSTIGINVRPATPPPTPGPAITACVANPVEIDPGGQASISYTATNFTVVTLNGLGVGNPVVVRPNATTTYTLIAYNAKNETARCEVTVRVKTPPVVDRPIANAGPSTDTIYRLLTLDGSKSSDPKGGTLKYLWRPLEKTAVVLDPTSVTPRVQLGEQFGPYIFELTVTTEAGISATSTVTVNFVSTRVR